MMGQTIRTVRTAQKAERPQARSQEAPRDRDLVLVVVRRPAKGEEEEEDY